MLIINNRFLSLYDYNFLLVIENRKIKKFFDGDVFLIVLWAFLFFILFSLSVGALWASFPTSTEKTLMKDKTTVGLVWITLVFS